MHVWVTFTSDMGGSQDIVPEICNTTSIDLPFTLCRLVPFPIAHSLPLSNGPTHGVVYWEEALQSVILVTTRTVPYRPQHCIIRCAFACADLPPGRPTMDFDSDWQVDDDASAIPIKFQPYFSIKFFPIA